MFCNYECGTSVFKVLWKVLGIFFPYFTLTFGSLIIDQRAFYLKLIYTPHNCVHHSKHQHHRYLYIFYPLGVLFSTSAILLCLVTLATFVVNVHPELKVFVIKQFFWKDLKCFGGPAFVLITDLGHSLRACGCRCCPPGTMKGDYAHSSVISLYVSSPLICHKLKSEIPSLCFSPNARREPER